MAACANTCAGCIASAVGPGTSSTASRHRKTGVHASDAHGAVAGTSASEVHAFDANGVSRTCSSADTSECQLSASGCTCVEWAFFDTAISTDYGAAGGADTVRDAAATISASTSSSSADF